jgi:hypothetical protein
MNIKHDQFIGIYNNAFSKDYCDEVIAFFENLVSAGFGVNRQLHDKADKLDKEDLAVFCNAEDTITLSSSAKLQKHFNDVFWSECYPLYVENNWILQSAGSHTIYTYKIQKTKIGQGYHRWHFESFNREFCPRVLAWTLYLNDVEEGGETEFIYQHMRVKPKQGTFVIFPASFTHAHRGNPPISNDKYIVTGWIEF